MVDDEVQDMVDDEVLDMVGVVELIGMYIYPKRVTESS